MWRSIEEYLQTDPVRRLIEPDNGQTIEAAFAQRMRSMDDISRRRFLSMLGASLAVAGLAGCSAQPPAEKIMPYVRQPEDRTLGKPEFYATAMPLPSGAMPILVRSNEGRPTKVEGNPNHPASGGATDVWSQAAILGLYDPDRSQSVTYQGRPRSWDEAVLSVRTELNKLRDSGGRGLCVLTDTVHSPTLAEQLAGDRAGTLRTEFPEARWVQFDSARSDSGLIAARAVFGRAVCPIYRLDRADVVVTLDSDLFSCGGGSLRYARDFMHRRRGGLVDSGQTMNRLYAAECTPTTTGAVADHRLPLSGRALQSFAHEVAAELGVSVDRAGTEEFRRFLAAVAKDLSDHRGSCLIVPGEFQPPEVHALAMAMNEALGNADRTVEYVDAVEANPREQFSDIRQLVQEMSDGDVRALIVLGANPVYATPDDLNFAAALARVSLRVHLGLYQDETAAKCDWHFPETHFLEVWSDARAYDGTVSIVQPVIGPLYGGKSAHEMLSAFLEPAARTSYEIVREYWRRNWPSGSNQANFERDWETAIHDGLIANTAFSPRTVSARAIAEWQPTLQDGGSPNSNSAAGDTIDILFRPDAAVYDGRFANNGWLQELPRSISKLTWDNAAIVSPQLAKKLGLQQTPGIHGGEHGEAIVEKVALDLHGKKLSVPALILPGQPENTVTLHLGYGRTHAGRVGSGVGANANQVRQSSSPWFDADVKIRATGEKYTLACTQMHHSMEGREPVRSGTFEEFHADQNFLFKSASHQERTVQRESVPAPNGQPAADHGPLADSRLEPLTLYPGAPTEQSTHRWGMSIDLTACFSCNACVIACQAENNIPVVGKEQVTRAHEMHWLRIDRYYTGDLENPTTYFQPVPCMQCENAPCELVCPVGATAHSADGLNDMVYNRCVGTRYCSNNCPYKVRRFNFLQFADFDTEAWKLGRNPEVTLRSRGVMEKCTYCVQRIRRGQIEAEVEGRPIHDGEIQTACQAVCPTRAIVFGDMNDAKSEVVQRKSTPLNYGLLADLNTRPRTTYAAVIRNPNPALE
jgi:Fe-S-cluster-containing dehydrogenase component/anaerobic selenocysteine-containing dehydrogenase